MKTLLLRRVLTSTLVLTAVVGCNAVLDNERAKLVVPGDTDVSPTEPTADGGATPASDASGGCEAGQHACGGACVVDTDPAHGCGTTTCDPCQTANATSVCRAGKCAVRTCEAGFADCNGDASDGCETDLSKAASCGACNAACPTALPLCVPSGATFACSDGCEPGAPLRCGDQCVNPTNDLANCGTCGNACPAGPDADATCVNGVCGIACKGNKKACNGVCVAPNDPLTCGPACTVCPTPPNTVATCPAEACSATCVAGFGDCNMAPLDGCETDLTANPAHCGVCGFACAVGETCVTGVCTPP